MIFSEIDVHVNTRHAEEPAARHRAFRLRINHIVDSFWLRIPKGVKTRIIGKLNVNANSKPHDGEQFWDVDGIACVELHTPNVASIYRASQPQAVKRVRQFLATGINIAARYDRMFAKNMKLWRHLLATAHEEFDHELGISRSHRSRIWRCDAVIRIGPKQYHYDLLVRESKTDKLVERHRLKSTECLLPIYSGVGFSKLRWEGSEIVGLAKDGTQVFRVSTGLPS